MTATVTRTKRAYDSSGRQAAAQRRRERVVEVATRLFAQHGWTGTTLALVAKEAGVSTELVSGAFGGKPGLLLTAVRSSTFGESGDIAGATAALQLDQVADPEERLDRAVEFAVNALRTMAPLMPAMIHAAGEDPKALDLIRRGREQRSQMARDLARLLGPGEAEPEQQTVDLVYLATSGEVYLQLTQELGWPEEQYAAWLRGELQRLVRG